MWIIPKNHQLSSHFALDMVASKEDLTLQELNIESSLMWRSKPSPVQTWLRRWKRISWLRHLFGRILKPSQHKSFETELISSLADIPAHHFHIPVYEKAPMTPDTSGPTSGDTSNQLDLFGASLRTSMGTSVSDSEKLSKTWKDLVTRRRGEYSARLKSAHLTRGNECTSWPTPTTHLAKEGGYPAEYTRNTPSLTAVAMESEGRPHSSGYLNPDWVEWLMGVPTGWTDLGSWETE